LFWVFSLGELLDLPPYFGLLDGHAMWHFGTILPWFWFWEVVTEDAILEEERIRKGFI
jgi:hypothetical protein